MVEAVGWTIATLAFVGAAIISHNLWYAAAASGTGLAAAVSWIRLVNLGG